MYMAIEETSVATAALVFYIKPALAPVLALLILGEAIAAGSTIFFMGAMRTAKPQCAMGNPD